MCILDDREQMLEEMKEIQREIQKLNSRVIELSENLEYFVGSEEKQVEKICEKHTDVGKITDSEDITLTNSQNSVIPIGSSYPYKKNTNKVLKTKKLPEREQTNKSNIEENVGKKLMGVLASLLIFIGLGSFVVLVFGSLSDTIKMCLMYLFSFGLFGIPLWRYKKNNVFLASLMGCGIGSVYISLIMTSLYFGIMNEIVLFACLLIWSFVVSYVGRRLNFGIFQVISYIGVSISLILAVGVGFVTSSFELLVLILIHVGVGVFFLQSLKSFSMGIQNSIRLLNVALTFVLIGVMRLMVDLLFLDFLYLPIMLILIAYNVYLMINYISLVKLFENKVGQGISTFVYISVLTFINCFIFSFICEGLVLNVDVDNLIILIYLIAIFIFIEFINLKNITLLGRNLLTVTLLLSVVSVYFSCQGLDNISSFIGLSFMIIPLILYKLKTMDKNENIFLYSSFILYFVSLSQYSGYFMDLVNDTFIGYIIFIALHIIPLLLVGKFLRKEDSGKIKTMLYVTINICLLFLSTTFSRYLTDVHQIVLIGDSKHFLYHLFGSLENILMYVLMSVFVFFVYYSSFCRSWVKELYSLDEVEKRNGLWYFNIVANVLLLFSGLILLYAVDSHSVLKLFILLITSLQCFINIKELLATENNQKGVFVGGIVTVYLTVLLNSYIGGMGMSYLYSILYIVLAVISVLVGFKTEIKSFRVYGLGLSLLGVLKLVLVDITYANSMSRILSFIGSGLLCFVIVWLYSKMSDKKKE